jgi:hypothetical protein
VARVRAHEREYLTRLEHFPSEKEIESMRAGKLTTLSAIVVLVGGTSLVTDLAIGQAPQNGQAPQSGQAPQRGQAPQSGSSMQASPGARGRAAGMRDMKHKIPQLSNIGTPLRIDAVVPRNVRQAAVPLPPRVQRMEPRFRNDRVFRYHDQVVIVDPTTSRIVAIVKAPT